MLNAPPTKLFDELLLIDAASNFTPSHSLMDFLRICFCTFSSSGQKLIYSNSLNLCSGIFILALNLESIMTDVNVDCP
mgnify:CR=1 FL=1